MSYDINRVIIGDVREIAKTLPDCSVNCIVTSPPYWGLRDYGTALWIGGDVNCDHSPKRKNGYESSTLGGNRNNNNHSKEGFKGDICPKCGAIRKDNQIGLESTPQEHVAIMVDVFRELRRVLRDDGTLWLNYGDCYATSANGRSAADTKAAGNDDRTYRDKPFSMVAGNLKPKDLVGMPWRIALALQDDGWYLRSDIIWSKTNPMPESVTDRPTKSHEYIFLLAKSERYYYDADAIREPIKTESIARLARGVSDNHKNVNGAPGQPAHTMNQPRQNRNQSTTFKRNGSKREQPLVPGQSHGTHRPDRDDTEYNPLGRNKRTVWTVSTKPYKEAHFATFPPDLIKPCILAGCLEGGVVLDPFMGSGTVAQVAIELRRNWLGIELNPEYAELTQRRIVSLQPMLIPEL